MENDKERPRVLIEEWFPFQEVGVECRRERGASSALPPISFLHVWWARRPLTVCKSAILGSILNPDISKEKFLKIMNFSNTIVEEYAKIIEAKKTGKRIKNPYRMDRAFKLNVNEEILKNLETAFHKKISDLKILDPMAGGGSIPFEALRLNLHTYAVDINQIAIIINYASLYYPSMFGKTIIDKVLHYSEIIYDKIKDKIFKYYPSINSQKNESYIWSRIIKCPNPTCNLEVPLAPNWNLLKKPHIILKLNIPDKPQDIKCNFKIIEKPTKEQIENNLKTVARGSGICPRCKSSLPSEYIKKEAQEGRMGHQIVAIVYQEKLGKNKTIRKFRTPNKSDIMAINEVDIIIEEKIADWNSKSILPDQNFPEGTDNRPLYYGMDKWYKFMNNRQLLANMTILESIIELKGELMKQDELELEEVKAILIYIHFAFDKIIARNCLYSIWDPGYRRIVHNFYRHDFAFKWSYAEMDVIRKGFNWAINNVLKAYKGIIELLGNENPRLNISISPAQDLARIEDNFFDIIIVDPPYYDNVMYAELSDFYYVWMKKTLGDLYPDIFQTNLTDKDNEAVANSSKFEKMGKSKKQLAKQDYEAKMLLCFKEMFRVLQENGVLTIMFTHKSTDAWDTLSMALMEAGFEITATWPVHTESEQSLLADKNSVKSTILLTCRKKTSKSEDFWWEDDVLPSIRNVVANKTKEFTKLGIKGVDLFIACFGPALKEFSKSYPVRNISGDIVRAEEAIEAARKVVVDITLKNIIQGKTYNIDPVSKFYLTAWHFFKARTFPYDEARRLSLSIGINIDDLKTSFKLLDKKSKNVSLILPKDREKNGAISLDNPKDNGNLINAVHIAILAYEEGGQKLFETVIEKLRRNTDKSFRIYMETLFNVLPDVKDLAKNLPEKKILGEILMTTEEKITPKGGKITDFLDK